MMKCAPRPAWLSLTLTSLILTFGMVGFLKPAIAQDTCFMVDSQGNTIDLGSLCQRGSGQNFNTSSLVRVPIKRREGGIPIIDVTFNGSHTYEMMVDTGASLTLITRQIADELGISGAPNPRFGLFEMADGATVQFQMARLESIAVSRASISNVEVAVADFTTIGLLGQNFFGNYDIRILAEEIEFKRR